MNTSPLRLRLMTRADLHFADSVRAHAGWNQTLADWERFLATEPEGCFLAEWNGSPAGTATTTVYGLDLGWIGMVLVHPEFRRRGIGRALLERCVEYLRALGVRCIKLDATPAGKQVYDSLGFRDEWTMTRWVFPAAPTQLAALEPDLRAWRASDADLIEPLDVAAFGVSRRALCRILAQQCRCALVFAPSANAIGGYGLLRTGARAHYLGPVVAHPPEVGLRLLDALAARAGGQTVFLDIPDRNAAAVTWVNEWGCTAQRPLTRMFLGENLRPGNAALQFALTGPETG